MERLRIKRPSSYKAPEPEVRRLAQEAEYVGSLEHKIGRWWGGQGNPPGPGGTLNRPKKQDTTVCPLRTQQDKAKATNWIQQAISDGCFVFEEGDKRSPSMFGGRMRIVAVGWVDASTPCRESTRAGRRGPAT